MMAVTGSFSMRLAKVCSPPVFPSITLRWESEVPQLRAVEMIQGDKDL